MTKFDNSRQIFSSSQIGQNVTHGFVQIETPKDTETSSNSDRLSFEQEREVQRLIDDAVKKESDKLKRKFTQDIQSQQEKIFTVTAVLTAVLAFVATQAVLLKDASPSAIISVSCISTGGIMMFAYLILAVLRNEKQFRPILFVSIGLIISGIILTGYSFRDLVHNVQKINTYSNEVKK